jgi:hypothetical protein
MSWVNSTALNPRKFVCGYCGNLISSVVGFNHASGRQQIYVCPHCDRPVYFNESQVAMPGVAFGSDVAHLPPAIEALYKEARTCTSSAAYTASVLLSRKLLMNIGVAQGADAGKPFIFYVEYLAANGYVPPNGKGWVDHIRKKGNEATHEIVLMSDSDAKDLIAFAEMLLKFIYEFPSRIPAP